MKLSTRGLLPCLLCVAPALTRVTLTQVLAQDVQPPQSRDTELRPQDDTPPDPAAARALVRRFDEAFNARDERAVDALFDLLHADRRAVICRRLHTALTGPSTITRTSTVEKTWTLGRHLIALVHVQMKCSSTGAEVGESQLVALTDRAGEARVTLAVEVDPAELAMIPDHAKAGHPKSIADCPPCNYHIDADSDWLMVPNVAQRVGCYESLSFWSLDHDLRLTLSLHLARVVEEPSAALLLLRDELGLRTPADVAVAPDPWTPPGYHADPQCTKAMRGAHARFGSADGSDVAEVWLASHGRVSYLFAARGPASAFDAGRDAIDRLLASFALDDTRIDPEVVAAAIERTHLAVECDGASFAHLPSGVRFTAPEGFQVRVAGGSTRFDASWLCPLGRPTLRLRGFAPPEGMAEWSTTAADLMLDSTIDRAHLTISRDDGWHSSKAGFGKEREFELSSGAALRRVMRVALDRDLFVVLEVDTTRSLNATQARACLAGLERRR